ncbi:hypothetical protein CR161_04645 [Prosthecochloris sp. ZM]|uniref:pentapeptide repeat-containing protein n=1 Tax=Prosthecochloris sp. ZM TaxID=2283143 RepID=UPI000DF7E64C|nr:pentapeptide repeat-containing protein [Prosthecochloris sp. ZM]RDD30055.1 hypothetical protein CR161_04645 [Prosthecochloris sp. ZM]
MKNDNNEFTENRAFKTVSFGEDNPLHGTYEECRFIHCNLNTTDLSGITFRNCSFESCDLSLARLRDTGFQDVHFLNCKLLGLNFSECRKLLLECRFESCMLKLSVFHQLDLRTTSFNDCNLQETDFTAADLSAAVFANCDLMRATFERTNLEKADFRSAFNYIINPENNRIRKARFRMPGVTGLLDIYDIEIE